MKEAYKLKDLGEMVLEEAKKEGLQIAEEAVEKLAKASYVGTKRWLKESAVISENKVDDFVAPYLDGLDAIVLPQIEKIDFDGDGK